MLRAFQQTYTCKSAGAEGYTISVNADGDLNFHNSGITTPTVTFADNDNVGFSAPRRLAHRYMWFQVAVLNLTLSGLVLQVQLRLTRGNRTDQGLYTDGPGIALRGTDASYGATQVRIAGDNVNANNYDRIEFTTENIERMRIDSSGRLLVGTTTEGEPNANNLTIADTGNCGLTLRSGSSNYGAIIYFSDATSGNGEFDGYIDYNQSTSLMRFGTASTTRVVIDRLWKLRHRRRVAFSTS